MINEPVDGDEAGQIGQVTAVAPPSRREAPGGGSAGVERLVARWTPEPRSVPAARRWLSEICRRSRATPRCDDAELVVTELMSNAIRHAGTPVEVEVEFTSTGALLLTVRDGSTRPVQSRTASLMSEGGRGLYLVDLLSDRWGVEADVHGKCVWAELT